MQLLPSVYEVERDDSCWKVKTGSGQSNTFTFRDELYLCVAAEKHTRHGV